MTFQFPASFAIAIPLLEKEITVSTKPAEIFRDNISGKNWAGGGIRTGGKGDIHGIRARIYMKMPSGKELVREFCYPERLSEEKFPWKD